MSDVTSSDDLTALSKIASLPKRICTRRRLSRRYLGALVIIIIFIFIYYVLCIPLLVPIPDPWTLTAP